MQHRHRPRKLLTAKALEALRVDIDRGVPISRAMQNTGIDASRPVVMGIYNAYVSGQFNDNLFPAWLDQDGPPVQSQPADWTYDGLFPATGGWKHGQH